MFYSFLCIFTLLKLTFRPARKESCRPRAVSFCWNGWTGPASTGHGCPSPSRAPLCVAATGHKAFLFLFTFNPCPKNREIKEADNSNRYQRTPSGGPDNAVPHLSRNAEDTDWETSFKVHHSNLITVNTQYSPSRPCQPKQPLRHGHPPQLSPGTACLLRLPWPRLWHPSCTGCHHLANQVFCFPVLFFWKLSK